MFLMIKKKFWCLISDPMTEITAVLILIIGIGTQLYLSLLFNEIIECDPPKDSICNKHNYISNYNLMVVLET
jgi:hypothetical protein